MSYVDPAQSLLFDMYGLYYGCISLVVSYVKFYTYLVAFHFLRQEAKASLETIKLCETDY